MNSKDFAIGLLSVTAAILFTGIVLIQALAPQPAIASGQSVSIGQYVVTTSRPDEVSEMIWILDTNALRMNSYVLNPQTNVLEIVNSMALRDLAQAQPGPQGRPRSTR